MGAIQFAQAISVARAAVFDAPWVIDSDDRSREKAAAERHLQHNIAAALDQGFALHDPLHPEFRVLDLHNQFGMVNPDNRYHVASISTSGTYVIRGRRGTSADLQIQVGGGCPGFDGTVNITPVSQMTLEDLVVDEDGWFEIVISDSPSGPNWMSNTNGSVEATSVLIRESFMDWETERSGTWFIERTDTRGTPSPLPDRALVAQQYERASDYLVNLTHGWIEFVKRGLNIWPHDALSLPRGTGDGGLPGQFSALGLFELSDSEAIVITVFDSQARYQSVQVGDLWFNGLDFARRQTSLTLAQARESSDGCYRMVISRRDPGVANWLDPAGASTIVAFLRWQGLPGRALPPEPLVQRVDLDQVRAAFPEDEPCFSPDERVKQLAARRARVLQSARGF